MRRHLSTTALLLAISSPILAQATAPRPSELALLQPELLISGERDDGEIVFASATGIAVTSRGHIVVGDNVSSRLLVFDSQGKLLRAIGRRGSGPGEFIFIRWLGHCGPNRIVAYDPSSARLSVFDDSLTLISTMRFAQQAYAMACDQNGRVFTAAPMRGRRQEPSGAVTSFFQLTVSSPPYSSHEPVIDDTLTLGEFIVLSPGILPRPLGPSAFLASTGRGALVYEETAAEARLLSTVNGEFRRLSLPIERIRATPADADAAIESIAMQVPLQMQGRARAAGRSIPTPEFLPRAYGLVTSDQGEPWLVTSRPSARNTEISQISRQGEVTRRLLLAGRVSFLTATNGRIVGVLLDDDGLPSVVAFRVPGR